MKQKRMSVRFDLDADDDRRAWEHLQALDTSRNRAVIDAINTFYEPVNPALKETIREVLHDCLQDVSFAPISKATPAPVISEDESSLLDSLDDLLGD